jgi:hypothetical protein
MYSSHTITDKNGWITDKVITQEHITLLTECAQARWKIENENNKVLQNYGYRLEHNFAPRRGCCVLNLPVFLVHRLMILCDEKFIKARSYFGRREEFYNAMRTFFWAFEFQTREDFLLFVTAHAGGG